MVSNIDLRCGDYREVLVDVEKFDALICDPPYSARTHEGARTLRDGADNPIDFASWGTADCQSLADFARDRNPRWIFIMCDHILHGQHDFSWCSAFNTDDPPYAFPPLPIIADTCRMTGDGPAGIPAWAFVARARTREMLSWGSLPAYYKDTTGAIKSRDAGIGGGKSIAMMRKIVCDYSRPGDLVCDPTAGAGTTAIACALEGRRFVGAEIRPEIHAMALGRIAKYTAQGDLFSSGSDDV